MTSFAKVAMMFRRFMDTLCGVSEDLLALGRRPSFYSVAFTPFAYRPSGEALGEATSWCCAPDLTSSTSINYIDEKCRDKHLLVRMQVDAEWFHEGSPCKPSQNLFITLQVALMGRIRNKRLILQHPDWSKRFEGCKSSAGGRGLPPCAAKARPHSFAIQSYIIRLEGIQDRVRRL